VIKQAGYNEGIAIGVVLDKRFGWQGVDSMADGEIAKKIFRIRGNTFNHANKTE
jgi:hypothetical protein